MKSRLIKLHEMSNDVIGKYIMNVLFSPKFLHGSDLKSEIQLKVNMAQMFYDQSVN